MKKVSLIVLTLLLLLFTACQRSDVWRPDFSGDEPIAVVQYKNGGEKESKRAETSEDIEKLQDLVARIEADTSTLTEIGKDGSTYVGGGTDYRFERSAQSFLEINWSEKGDAYVTVCNDSGAYRFRCKSAPQKAEFDLFYREIKAVK